MAALAFSSALAFPPVARLRAALGDWAGHRRRYRQLLAELRDYSVSELNELGIDPCRLEPLAWEAAALPLHARHRR